ncbi:hypothetical protein C8F04DRAFT_1182415 [Mycena alexandri]|uniref:Uncharacterized protein n=1 Tax=Mycena alexandri TaxID=1745969 RepID=A0AAD6SWS7_9AGAR|nr:hypothetical protein C8F04DRAFT_1182415 [Mycena alexandri]
MYRQRALIAPPQKRTARYGERRKKKMGKEKSARKGKQSKEKRPKGCGGSALCGTGKEKSWAHQTACPRRGLRAATPQMTRTVRAHLVPAKIRKKKGKEKARENDTYVILMLVLTEPSSNQPPPNRHKAAHPAIHAKLMVRPPKEPLPDIIQHEREGDEAYEEGEDAARVGAGAVGGGELGEDIELGRGRLRPAS